MGNQPADVPVKVDYVTFSVAGVVLPPAMHCGNLVLAFVLVFVLSLLLKGMGASPAAGGAGASAQDKTPCESATL
eukprot:5766396-Amphidinium_carterae.1